MDFRTIREFLHESLHNTTTKKARVINGILSFLVIFSITVIPLHFLLQGDAWAQKQLMFFDKLTVTIFTIEYFLRAWSDRSPIRFIFSWEGLVDLVAVLPFYLAQLGLFDEFEIFLLLRILRILKFSVMYGYEQEALQRCQAKRHGSFYILPHEHVERVIQKHPLFFIASLFLPMFFTSMGLTAFAVFHGTTFGNAFTILCFFFAGIFFIRAWLNYNYDVMYITNYRVIVQDRKLFGSETNAVVYQSITNIIPDDIGFWHWALGTGHLTIETAATDAKLLFENVQHPHKIVKKIAENRQIILNNSIISNRRNQEVSEE